MPWQSILVRYYKLFISLLRLKKWNFEFLKAFCFSNISFFSILCCLFFIRLVNFSFDFIVIVFSLLFICLLFSFSYRGFLYSISFLVWVMVILSIIICSLMILRNFSFMFSSYNLNYLFLVFLIIVSLVFFFCSSSIFYFYLFFELSVIPIFFIISGYGVRFERFQSAIYMFFYTLTFSLPFLIFLFSFELNYRTMNFIISKFIYYRDLDYCFVFFSVFMFFVKVPSFFLHLWLPKAHVEAPSSGSIILAGLLLKLGVYGLIVFLDFVFFQMAYFSEFFFFWGIWGSLLASFVCFRQVDLKKMIAYISIIHMGICISSLFSFYSFSILSVSLMIVAHGFSSSLMFYSLACFYERIHTRRIILVKGATVAMPLYFFFLCLVVFTNMSVPPSLNFFSELLLFFCMVGFYFYTFPFLLLLIFLSSLVSLYYLVSISRGNFIKMNISFDLSQKESLVHLVHLFPLFTCFLLF